MGEIDGLRERTIGRFTKNQKNGTDIYFALV